MLFLHDWRYKINTMFYFRRHLADQTLMVCKTHSLGGRQGAWGVGGNSFLSSSHTGLRRCVVLTVQEREVLLHPP